MYRNEVILLNGWLGKSRWSLPGGGISRHEDKLECAVREVREEVGIDIESSQLKHMGRQPYTGPDTKANYPIEYFFVELDKQAPIKIRQPWEIIEAHWFSLDSPPGELSQTTQTAIRLAHQHGLLR